MEPEIWEVWFIDDRTGKEICWGAFDTEQEADNGAAVLGCISPGIQITVCQYDKGE